ncbi:MAG TPA: MATE family efflux transporter [Firmicutes bacterium]|nr:MATE family efflux transporter [Bacillota bacterium]
MGKMLKKFKSLFDPIDLTKGKIWKVIIAFFVPIVLSMLFQQVYTLTDTIIVGQTLSEQEVAGVSSSSALVWLVLQFGMGCTSGFSVVISERIGAKDLEGARKSYCVQVVLSIFISLTLTIIGFFCIPYMLKMINIVDNPLDPIMKEEYDAAYTYVLIIYMGTLAQVFYNLMVSILRALGDSFAPFLFLVGSTIVNVFLDLLFIIVFKMGVSGSAYATIISQGLAAIAAIIYAYKKYEWLRIRKEDWKFNGSFLLRHLKNGLPMGFQFSILEIGIIIMQGAVNSFDINMDGSLVAGVPAQVGYGAASKIFGFLMAFLNALGTAMLSFISQNYGAGEKERIKKGTIISFILGTSLWAFIVLIGLLSTINGAYLYIFYSASKINPSSIKYGNQYLYVSIPCMFILMLLFLTRNILQGFEKPLFPFLAGIGELTARTLICLFAPALINGGPINSDASTLSYIFVAMADPLAWVAATSIMIIPTIRNCFFKTKEK